MWTLFLLVVLTLSSSHLQSHFHVGWVRIPSTLLLLCNAWLLLAYWSLRALLRRSILRQSEPRGKTLLAAVERNKEDFSVARKVSSKSDDDEWEHVRGSSEHGNDRQSPKDEYDGFIGFFHPFALVSISDK